jgi:hypothetical protein
LMIVQCVETSLLQSGSLIAWQMQLAPNGHYAMLLFVRACSNFQPVHGPVGTLGAKKKKPFCLLRRDLAHVGHAGRVRPATFQDPNDVDRSISPRPRARSRTWAFCFATRKAAASRRSPPKKIPLGNRRKSLSRPRLKKPQHKMLQRRRDVNYVGGSMADKIALRDFFSERALARCPKKWRQRATRKCDNATLAALPFFGAAGESCHTVGRRTVVEKNTAKPALNARLLHPAGLLRNFLAAPSAQRKRGRGVGRCASHGGTGPKPPSSQIGGGGRCPAKKRKCDTCARTRPVRVKT